MFAMQMKCPCDLLETKTMISHTTNAMQIEMQIAANATVYVTVNVRCFPYIMAIRRWINRKYFHIMTEMLCEVHIMCHAIWHIWQLHQCTKNKMPNENDSDGKWMPMKCNVHNVRTFEIVIVEQQVFWSNKSGARHIILVYPSFE